MTMMINKIKTVLDSTQGRPVSSLTSVTLQLYRTVKAFLPVRLVTETWIISAFWLPPTPSSSVDDICFCSSAETDGGEKQTRSGAF